MYDRSSADTSVNDARLDFFARKQRPYDAIPPKSAPLKLHSKHATYQGRIIWGPLSLDLSQRVQLIGDGVGEVTRGRYFELTFHQLL